ncbi:MAG: hypothetical protein IPK16_31325 [Anaerolineales bacterium]|nr:hypothetical protein [Anaerolineales bacterium]
MCTTQDPGRPGVRIVDGATLQQTAVFTQAGAPLFNPVRNELLIVAYTVYTADPASLRVTGDLFPALTDLDQVGFLWCNGCTWADHAAFHPKEQLISIDLSAHCAGKGCGNVSAPVFLDAATLSQVPPQVAPEMQADCGSSSALLGAVDGRRYHNEMYDRYVVFTNLRVVDETGAPITWRDGLRTEFINPRTNHGYLYEGTVLDLATLSPIGQWPAACLFAYESDTGLLFGKRGGNLRVISQTGAEPATPPTSLPGAPATQVDYLAVSPNYAVDATLLAGTSDGAVYRSTDAGAAWEQLRGNLPQPEPLSYNQLTLRAFFSPNYGADRTLYATGYRSDYWGEGVWRSQDSGATWEPLWTDLLFLRGHRLDFSPDFAQNQTLALTGEFNDLQSGASGVAIQQSTDGGLHWQPVITDTQVTVYDTVPAAVASILPGYNAPLELPVRIGGYGNLLEYTFDGADWITTTVAAEEGDLITGLFTVPTYPDNPTIYAFSHRALWRTTDGGQTWARWADPRLDNLTFEQEMTAIAVSPVLADSRYQLFIAFRTGEIWVIDPARMAWNELPGATPAPVADAAPTETTEPEGAADTAPPATNADTAEPPTGFFRPGGIFGLMWAREPKVQTDLGWATQENAIAAAGAVQRFENGVMVWRGDANAIYIFSNDGTWQRVDDTFKEGDPEKDFSLESPQGKRQPERGFGKIWRSQPEVREKLGWAIEKESAKNLSIQPFERGIMMDAGGSLFVMPGSEERGTWY